MTSCLSDFCAVRICGAATTAAAVEAAVDRKRRRVTGEGEAEVFMGKCVRCTHRT